MSTRGKKHNTTVIRIITRIHKALYRWSGGAVGGLLEGLPNLLLTTVGRRSGKHHTTPLCYLPDGLNFIVVGSYGGSPKDPQWWQNLQANGQGWAQVGRKRWPVKAEQASEELKARMWPVFCRHYPSYIAYQSKTDRVIPLVVLTPATYPE